MAPRLRLVNTTHLAENVEHVAYCDPHDLVAICTVDSKVVVYRINGQVAYSITTPDDSADISAMSWKHDGSRLAIGWIDGSFALYSGEDGKLLYSDTVSEPNNQTEHVDSPADEADVPAEVASPAACDEDENEHIGVSGFGWMKHTIDPQAHHADSRRTSRWHDDDSFLDDAEPMDSGTTRSMAKSITRLTRTLMTMDVTEVLPKLSSIPSHGLLLGTEGNKFSTQTSTDMIMEPQRLSNPNEVDILMVLTTRSKVTVILDDAVKIGQCTVGWQPMHHTSLPDSSIHIVIAHDDFEQNYQTSFVKLPLETLGGPLLSVIATNTKRLKNLVAYIAHTVRCIEHDYTTGIQTPNRFIASANSTLAEGSQGDLKVNLMELALTGRFSPPMLEWLTDILREVNHKRWDQAVSAMYSNIQNHIFINLLPALERISTAATTLRGHSCVADSTAMFNVEPEMFTKILAIVDSLRVVALHVQSLVIDERQQFNAFSKWLRVMIEIGVAVPGSKSANETEEREVPNFDYKLILAYINSNIMTESALAKHVGRWQNAYIDLLEHIPDLPDDMQQRSKYSNDNEQLVFANMPLHALNLDPIITETLQAITNWQSTMLSTPPTHDVQTPPCVIICDVRMHKNGAVAAVGRCLAEGQHHKVYVTTVSDPAQNPATFENVQLAASGQLTVEDVKFFNDGQDVLMLVTLEEGGYEIRKAQARSLIESAYRHMPLSTVTLHASVDGEESFGAHKFYVSGRKGKEVLLVLAARSWQILDLHKAESDEMML